MTNPINILIVDDHPFIIQAYKNALDKYSQQGFEFAVTQANSCKTGYESIKEAKIPFDVAFFDISMPEYAEKGIYSGEDLAALIKTEMPNCKIILLTMHSELLKINNIIKNINPSGLIIKNDLTFDELIFAFDKIINNQSYYSQTVIKLVGQAQYTNIELDAFDKQILFHLSKGVKSKDLPQYIPISLNAVEKRILNISEILEVKGGTETDLINEAKIKGII
ncbi:response regulator [Flavobacterium sp. N1994]|uniref:response regulator n=1 Tax=Flavobacterium sp. N1994 TaxID=2986827 RepID=UPI002221EA68|nr:response regulator [Flavobacterium sp. N1994]